MKTSLIGAPTADARAAGGRRTDSLAESPPLGILSLAAVLEGAGLACEVVDLNRFLFEGTGASAPAVEDFFQRASGELIRAEAEVLGFSTLSSTYPLTVRLAAEVKRARPETIIIFGGPQASAVDVQTLEAFPFVDLVVRGEAEGILPQVLAAEVRPADLGPIDGITFRRGGRVVRNPDPAELPDMDTLPLPAYHRWPGLADRVTIPLEIGRGCPFACAFCSTSGFFRRRFRLKTPARVLEEMRAIRQAHGIGTFTLMHDSFTADRSRAAAFCQALIEAGEDFEWSCSARTDCLDEDLLELMARAGCMAVFLGIETGSARLQREIHKELDLGHAMDMVRRADGLGMRTVVSLIAGFPSETQADLESTVEFLSDSVRLTNVDAQFHLLAPLAGSAIYEQYRGRLEWDGLISDMALHGPDQDDHDRALALQYPDVFPNFYAVPMEHLDRAYVAEVRDFVQEGLARFRWLLLALEEQSGGLPAVFARWRTWRAERGRASSRAEAAFRRDLLEFARSACLDGGGPEAAGLATVVEYEEAVDRVERSSAGGGSGAAEIGGQEAVPRLAPGVAVVTLEGDYLAIVECLREKRSTRDVPRRRVMLADRQRSEERAEVFELAPLAAALLGLCDGRRTVKEIANVFPELEEGLKQLPAGPACLFALRELASEGLIVC